MNMERKQEIVAACSAVIIAGALLKKKKRKPRKWWVRIWLAARDKKSAYNNILQELRLDDKDYFRRYLRMNTVVFDELVRLVRPMIGKKCTRHSALFGYGRILCEPSVSIPNIQSSNFNFHS